jgi:hypothetical protein
MISAPCWEPGIIEEVTNSVLVRCNRIQMPEYGEFGKSSLTESSTGQILRPAQLVTFSLLFSPLDTYQGVPVLRSGKERTRLVRTLARRQVSSLHESLLIRI